MKNRSGGCLCGSVRYELKSEPYDAGWCHCRTCQLFSGAPAMAFACVPVDDWDWTSGADKVRRLRSSNFGHREFCGECGTPLRVAVDHQPETVDFPIVTLDEPDDVRPEFHIFFGRKVAWFDTADDLPLHEKFRPETRGLEGTEPPDESSLAGGA
jgi:hypothetical protein